jgi:hypothetical protein
MSVTIRIAEYADLLLRDTLRWSPGKAIRLATPPYH